MEQPIGIIHDEPEILSMIEEIISSHSIECKTLLAEITTEPFEIVNFVYQINPSLLYLACDFGTFFSLKGQYLLGNITHHKTKLRQIRLSDPTHSFIKEYARLIEEEY